MGARNPKMARLSLNLAEGIDQRVAALADAAGMNKGTMAALLVATALRQMEVLFLTQQGQATMASQFVQDNAQGQLDDMRQQAPAGFIKG